VADHQGEGLDHRRQPARPTGVRDLGTGGGRYAVLGGDLLSDDPIAVVLIDPSVATAFDIPVGRDVVAAPPVWIDDDRLVVVTATRAHRRRRSSTPRTGRHGWTRGARLIAASANGKRVATMAKQGAPVMVRDMDGWLASDGTAIGSVAPPDGVSSAISFALDATGQRLAIAWAGTTEGQPRRARGERGLAPRGPAEDPDRVRRRGRLDAVSAVNVERAAAPGCCETLDGDRLWCGEDRDLRSSGSITPKTFWSARRWTHEPQLSK
jgi:hypothetical protein